VSGTYYIDTNGAVQFEPATPFPTNLRSVTIQTAPDVGHLFRHLGQQHLPERHSQVELNL
jgi:hypothetical protein